MKSALNNLSFEVDFKLDLYKISAQNFSIVQALTFALRYLLFTLKETVFHIINRRITMDAIWSCHFRHVKQVLTKITVSS